MITIKGEPRELPDGTSVVEVVTEVVGAPETRGVAVAVNGEVVPRTSWATTAVGAGDRRAIRVGQQGTRPPSQFLRTATGQDVEAGFAQDPLLQPLLGVVDVLDHDPRARVLGVGPRWW